MLRLKAGKFRDGCISPLVLFTYHHLYDLGLNLTNVLTMVTPERVFRLEAGLFIFGQVGTVFLLISARTYGLDSNLTSGLTMVTPEEYFVSSQGDS